MTAQITGNPVRRQAIRDRGLNGIDRVEAAADRKSVVLTLLNPVPDGLDETWIDLHSEVGTTSVRAVAVRVVVDQEAPGRGGGRSVSIALNRAADARDDYRLRVSRPGDPAARAPRGFDPWSCEADVDFTVRCSTGLDCRPIANCPPDLTPEPALNYLAKDYRAFRQLLLDRLALIMPGWTERHVPDLQLTLVELLAYVGDQLSYHQDAVATEAYLQTARRRISVRRHARLVDYAMHEGCNARAWVAVTVSGTVTLRPEEFRFIAGTGAGVIRYDPGASTGGEVFEPTLRTPVRLRHAHNRIAFWTGGAETACLPVGSTSATLVDGWVDAEGPTPAHEGVGPAAAQAVRVRPARGGRGGRRPDRPRRRLLDLRVGDVVMISERVGPATGAAADADPGHRQAVRLTSVTPSYDVVFEQPVVEIGWADCDALTFSVCLATIGPDCRLLHEVSVVCGNLVLVDHGRSIDWCGSDPETLDLPPATSQPVCCDPCGPTPGRSEPGSPASVPWRPRLIGANITIAQHYPDPDRVAGSQATVLRSIPRQVQESVRGLLVGRRELEPDELDELETVFGSAALATSMTLARRSRRGGSGHRRTTVEWLVHRWDRLLRNKIRRIGELADRAGEGYVLDAGVTAVVAAEWGERWLAELDPVNPARHGPACHALTQDPRRALPVLELTDGSAVWRPVPDLLSSGPDAHALVVEIDDERAAHLRFGDGESGAMPVAGRRMRAWYRVGGGAVGNVGRGVINRMEFCGVPPVEVVAVSNPLPASGGVDPESVDEVRQLAPYAFADRSLRAVKAADYAGFAAGFAGVQSAAASLVWTGSWYEADVVLDPRGTARLRPEMSATVATNLDRFRQIGHDLRVGAARPVPVDLGLRVCVRPHSRRGDVLRAVLDELRPGIRADGRRGFFDPDALVIGAPVVLSGIVARVAGLAGVLSVSVLRFERWGDGDHGELDTGVLRLRPRELARMENDPLHPENGQLTVELVGGR